MASLSFGASGSQGDSRNAGKLRTPSLCSSAVSQHEVGSDAGPFGNSLCCPSFEEPIALAIFANGVYEPDTVAGIVGRIPKNGVYLDVGANIGAIALPVARHRPDVRVICIEADPATATVLRRNVANNALPNVTVAECLAGSCSKEAVRFYTATPDRIGMGSVGPQFD